MTIALTDDQIAAICEALRYMAADMNTIGSRHRQKEINALRRLAGEIEQQLATSKEETHEQ